jgi:SanA protein
MRRFSKFIVWGFVLVIGLVLICEAQVISSARGRMFARVSEMHDQHRVALVLGCAKNLPDGRSNHYFPKRIEAAAALFKAGICPAIIVSGDNSTKDYDEPSDMKAALIASGVPEGKIYCDYAGFRTLDSIVRAREVFGQSKIIVVSQRFHNERALYLAGSQNVDAIGFNAADAELSKPTAIKNGMREILARVKAVLDANVLRTQPKFLGSPVQIVME